jgi:hypothetical protein
MVLESNLPPVSFQSIVTGQWYIVTTKEWVKVDRKYGWDEIKTMWQPFVSKPAQPQITKPLNISKRIYKVKGSKDNVYDVKYDSGRWSCTCPAFGWSRGKECKHIKSIRTK